MKNFAKFLPSRRFSAILGSLVFVVALIWGAKILASSSSANKTENSMISPPTLVATGEIERLSFEKINKEDGDGDGLKDWEEILWQTDPNNKDTDGDGVNDNEEIQKNRAPRKKGPNDVLNLPVDASGKLTQEGEVEKLNATDIIARDFFSKYVQAKQGGKELDGTIEQQIASSVLLQAKSSTPLREYTEGDLIVEKESTNDALKNYGEKMGAIIKTDATWKENELSIIQQALEQENEKILEQLDPIIFGYSSMLEKMLLLHVPQKATESHLDLLNAMAKIISALKAAQNVFTDPVTTMATFGKYPEIITSLHRSFLDARGLFQRNNISYDPQKESGYYYSNFADAIDLQVAKNNTQ